MININIKYTPLIKPSENHWKSILNSKISNSLIVIYDKYFSNEFDIKEYVKSTIIEHLKLYRINVDKNDAFTNIYNNKKYIISYEEIKDAITNN